MKMITSLIVIASILIVGILAVNSTVWNASDAQTAPKQAVAFNTYVDLQCGQFRPAHEMRDDWGKPIAIFDSIWRSWTPEDTIPMQAGSNTRTSASD